MTSAWQNSKESACKAQEELDAARAILEETKAALSDKTKDVAAEKASIEGRINAKVQADEECQRLLAEFQNLQAGISLTQGVNDAMTLPDQIAKAHSASKTAEAKVKQATMKMKHLTKELSVRCRRKA